jgi:hypothetical protein
MPDQRTGWIPSNNLLAAISHVAIAVAIAFSMSYLFNVSPWWTVIPVAAWIAVKEFVFDLMYVSVTLPVFGVVSIGEGDTFADSCVDAAWYCVGWLASIGACYLAGKL